MWRPGQIELPDQVRRAFPSVVRIRARDIRFRLTVFETAEAASAARRVPHARDKEFADDGGVVWPVFMSRADLEGTCAMTSASLSPGIYELCQAFRTANCVAYPCKIMTNALASSAAGVAIAPNADIVSGDSGGPLINSEGEVVAIVHNSLCKPDGEIDLSTTKFCGMTLGTNTDPVILRLLKAPGK